MAEPNFEGHDSRYCGEHRTVGPHRAWCFDCSEWCYPHEGCARCREPKHENEIARLRCNLEAQEKLLITLQRTAAEAQQERDQLRQAAAHGLRNPPEVIAELIDSRNEAQRTAMAYQNAAADYRDMQDRAEGLKFQRDELRRIIQRVREVHFATDDGMCCQCIGIGHPCPTIRIVEGGVERLDTWGLCKAVNKHDMCSMAACVKDAEHDDDHMCALGHRWSDQEAQGDDNGDRG